METKEKISVFIRTENGKTLCICPACSKRCRNKECQKDIVERDKFREWENVMHRNRYGK